MNSNRRDIPGGALSAVGAPIRAALVWLRKRVLPGGDDIMMVAAYAIVLTALIVFVLQSDALPAWRYYGTILALAAILALYLSEQDLCRSLGEQQAQRITLGAAAFLFLLAFWMADAPAFSFIPYILFVLVSQALTTLAWRPALLVALLLYGGTLGIIGLDASAAAVGQAGIGLGLGVVFTTTFTLVLIGYNRQRESAERLLHELQRTNAELELARVKEKALAAAEERVRLAREIHDGLGHHLTVLNIQLQAAERLIERDPQRAAAAIGVCRAEAQAALADVRQSVATMRSSPLDGRALDVALRQLVDDFDARTELVVRFSQQGDLPPLVPAAAMTLYRAAQEGLTNAQKHAAAHNVAVMLQSGSQLVRLEVCDDGSARNGAGQSAGGFGLAGLRERAEQLGGCLAAGARPQGGFQLVIEVPAAAAARTDKSP